MNEYELMEKVSEYVAQNRKDYIKGWKAQHKGAPPKTRPLQNAEFVQWFEAMMASSPRVTIRATKPPATDWVEEGTLISGPAWFLAIAMPSAEDTAREIARYRLLTGARNPLEEALRGSHR